MSTMNLPPSATKHSSWVDGKRWWWLLGPAAPALAAGLIFAVIMGASSLLLWIMPVMLYAIAPLLDLLIGEDQVNPPETVAAELEADHYYRWIVYAFIPSQYLLVVLGAWLAARGELVWWEWLALIASAGALGGNAINTAHELGHKNNVLERWLAKIVLAPVAYGHFFIEHNRGHHKNVATPEDPASARMGESFWHFLPRTVLGSLISAWRIEAERLQRYGKPVWSLNNENLQAWGLSILLFGGLTAWLGSWALLFLIGQAIVGFTLLEVVNYLEHYGLLRQKLANGRYERCQPRHSWNSNQVVTNVFLYQLQRHSDHHAHPTRRYQALRHFDESPQLPAGYGVMILVALFPPLWFRLMDSRVVAHHHGDLTKANLYAPRRDLLLTRWAHKASQIDRQRAVIVKQGIMEQKKIAQDATQYQCPNCNYVYDVRIGCPNDGYPAGTSWRVLPESWQCPDCAVCEKPDFVMVSNIG